MSCKRRGNVMPEYVEDTSSDDDRNDAQDFDYDVSLRGRAAGKQDYNSIGSNISNDSRRRGRGVSKRPCLNRNAQMARENRQRKKEYLEKVENKLAFYRQENKNLSNLVQRQGIDLKRLKAEVSYLKNVLNNSSSITTLLKSMNDTLAVKNSNNTNKRIDSNFRNRKDSGNEHCNDKEDELTSKMWKDAGRTTWRRTGKFIDRSATRKNPHEVSAGNLNIQTLEDSDHTYTTSGDGSCNEKLGCYDEIDISCSKDSGNYSEIGVDRFINDLSGNPMNFGISDDIDGLLPFDSKVFDAIGNEDANESSEYFRNDGFNDDPGNLFESLENSGICLHVNSGKISLEFCSICHLNSINSTE